MKLFIYFYYFFKILNNGTSGTQTAEDGGDSSG